LDLQADLGQLVHNIERDYVVNENNNIEAQQNSPKRKIASKQHNIILDCFEPTRCDKIGHGN
jgi:hypothetical protein